jgi:hypothetical protein
MASGHKGNAVVGIGNKARDVVLQPADIGPAGRLLITI